MIHVKVGRESFQWEPVGRTVEIIEADPMLTNHLQYDTIIVNHAHQQPNIKAFASICKKDDVRVVIGGLHCDLLEELVDIADVYEHVADVYS